MSGPSYIGRFAPSPTGPLHLGSLIAAVGSFLEARSRGGRWLVRIEDLDPPREVPGAADQILRQLEAYGLHWDDEVVYQSRRESHYLDALAALRRGGRAYDCGCSRREIAEAGLEGMDGPVYPGTCRGGLPDGREARTVRLLTDDRIVAFRDRVQGPIRQRLESAVGDFVIRRADGLFAYQLAVVVDDAAQGITEVVRGADLLASTPRQVFIQGLLGLPTPSYLHLPMAIGTDGQKLSKQTQAPALPLEDPLPPLREALRFLGQPSPPTDRLAEFWASAIAHWDPRRIPPVDRIDVSAAGETATPLR